MLVTDPKGQLAAWTANYRQEKFGHEIAVLDPFGITGRNSVSINPFSPLIEAVKSGKRYRSEAERLAHLVLPELPNIKDPYWRNGGRKMIMAGLLYLASVRPDHCDLPGLHDFLWLDEEQLEHVLNDMMQSRALGGALRQRGADIWDTLDKREKEFGSFREEARQALSIYAPDEPCGQGSRHSDMDFKKLLTGNLTVYLVLPPEHVVSHGRWMGLVTDHAIHSIMSVKENGDCIFLLDEFPNLGKLPGIISAIAQLREKGLRVWVFVQELSQLESVYGRADADSMRHQAEVLQILGCRTVELARYVEARAGTKTDKVASFNIPSPLDPSRAPEKSLKEEKTPLFSSDRVLNMPKFRQILIRHGYPVIEADVKLWSGEC